MNDDAFETALRSRLLRLDAAVPAFAAPAVSANTRSPGSRRRRQVLVLLVATAALMLATAVATFSAPVPRTPAELEASQAAEEQVRNALFEDLGGACRQKAEVVRMVRATLDRLGHRDWTIRADDDRVREAPCVGTAAIGDSAEVMLMPSMGERVAGAMDQVALDLMERCLDHDGAIQVVTAALRGAGVEQPDVRSGGMPMVPIGQEQAYADHVARGCYVYAGAQFDQVGRYTWYVRGA
jgi:hypothetical protein